MRWYDKSIGCKLPDQDSKCKGEGETVDNNYGDGGRRERERDDMYVINSSCKRDQGNKSYAIKKTVKKIKMHKTPFSITVNGHFCFILSL